MLSAVGLALVGGWLAAGVVDSRGALGAAPYAGSAPALPDRMAVSGPKPADVTQQPAGPAIAAYLDDDDESSWWVFVSANRSAYRTLEAGGYFPGSNKRLLLSPDGTRASVATFEAGRPSRVDVVDLVSGDVRPVPGLQLADDDAPLSWSPDNQHLALRLKGRLAVVDASTGEMRQFKSLVREAAYSPAGDRIALSLPGDVSVVDHGTGRLLTSHPVGGYAVSSAGWSPDSSTIALQSTGEPTTTGFARLDLTTGKVFPAGAESNGTTAIAWRSNTVLVASSPGRPALSAFDVSSGRPSLLSNNTSEWHPTAHSLTVATALAPRMDIVAAQNIDRGHAYTWYAAWPLAIIVMALVGRKWPRPGSQRRKSSTYLWITGLLTTPATAVLAVFPILIAFEVLLYGGKLDSLGLAGFSYTLACLLATTLLGAAALVAGLITRPYEGPVPVSQLPRPLISTTG